MTKSNKILISAVAGVLAVCLCIVGVVSFNKNNHEEPTVTATNSQESSSSQAVSDTSSVTDTSTSSSQPVTDAVQLKQALVGKWTDSANMSGYEFFSDGTVKVTYVNLVVPVINLPVNGTANGVYTVDGDILTTKFSIYSATIEDRFRVSVENNMLSLYNLEELETSTYTKVSSAPTTTGEASAVTNGQTGINGSWLNSDESVRYSFEDDGTIYVTHKSSTSEHTYKGIYLEQENSVIIQYTESGKTVTENYVYTVSANTLSLTDAQGNIYLFARSGSSVSASANSGIIGTWRDGANMSGYTFKHGGVVDVTYVNFTVPVINMPINGTYTGSYVIDGNNITVSYSIYGKSMVEKYTYTISENALTLTKTDDGTVKTYVKQ